MFVSRSKRARYSPPLRLSFIERLEQRQLLTAVSFTIDPAQSSLTLSGAIHSASNPDVVLQPQAPGSLVTAYSGTIAADVLANSIQFTNASSISALNNGTWAPGAAAGDYGAAASSIQMAVRGLVASGSSSAIPIAANGAFSSAAQSLAITGGQLDYTVEGDSSRSLVGLTSTNSPATSSTYIVSNGKATLTIPVLVTYTTSVVSTNDTTLTLTGALIATAPAPLIPTSISGNVHAAAGLPNVTVYIDSKNNGVLDGADLSTTTDSAGNYTLSGFPGGSYIVRQVPPPGYKQVTPTNGYGNHITVASGKNAPNSNFVDAVTSSSISGTVHTPGNIGLMNVTVYADLNNNGKLDGADPSIPTDAAGAYTLTNLAAGNYIIRQILPAGYSQVTPSNGFGIHTAITTGKSVTNAGFSDILIGTPTASISGEVYNDANANSKMDPGEGGLAGWTLYLDLNNTHLYVPADPTATTDANGNFSFSSVAAGSYIVRTTQPPGWLQITPASNFGQHVTLKTGQTIANLLFGEIFDD